MRIVTPEFQVDPNNLFENDILDRRIFAETLSQLILSSQQELVLCLDGKWGEGKTTFVRMWQGYLKSIGVHSIYIDAFANDYFKDPFICVASAIQEYAQENISKDNAEKLNELKEGFKTVGTKLLSWSLKIGAKAATLGVVKDSDVEELLRIKDDLAKGASAFIEKYIEEKLTERKAELAALEQVKCALSNLPEKLSGENKGPLVIIIDELDRCRPAFAVELLEKCKHIFSVKNIVFVLVMHKEQLEESVKLIYGGKIDAHAYLQKFITIETRLPKKTEPDFPNDYKAYLSHLHRAHEANFGGSDQDILRFLQVLSIHFKLSLRQMEKAFSNLVVHQLSSKQDNPDKWPIITLLCVLKVSNPELFKKLAGSECEYQYFLAEFGEITINPKSGAIEDLKFILDWVRYYLCTDQELNNASQNDRIKRFGTGAFADLARPKMIRNYCRLLDCFMPR